MTPYAVSLNFNNRPFLIFGGIVAAFLLLTIAARIIAGGVPGAWRDASREP